MARRKRRKEENSCQQLLLVPSSLVPGLEITWWPWEQGTLSSGSWEFSGTACPTRGLPRGALPLRQGAENKDCALHHSNLGGPSPTPGCVWSKKEAPGPTCLSPGRDEGRALMPRHHTREAVPATHAGPATQPYRGFKAGDGSLEIMCKYANYFIMSLA